MVVPKYREGVAPVSRQPTVGRLLAALLLYCSLAALLVRAETQEDKDLKAVEQQVQALLPPHSALPPIGVVPAQGPTSPRENFAWEQKYVNGIGLLRTELIDPGIRPGERFSIGTQTVEGGVGGVDLPVRGCPLIVLGHVRSRTSYLAQNRHLIYIDYEIAIDRILKNSERKRREPPTEVHALEFGGALRYPSGHTQFFVTTGSSYLGDNQECLIFLWKPFPMPAYNIGQVYMIEADGAVYPISRSIKYKWTSKDSLVAAVTSAIKANVNR